MELLAGTATETLIDASWTHLGDRFGYTARAETGTVLSQIKASTKRMLWRMRMRRNEGNSAFYSQTDFREWRFNKGDHLPFDSEAFSFAYSEHVLEHFRYDVACDLMRECHRVLRENGVFRIVVPDADYRTYEAVESVGFPSTQLPFTHPNKHKMRWNVYLLQTTLELLGFKAIPVVWTDDAGSFQKADLPSVYSGLEVDSQLVLSLSYVQRPRSLIVDGVKI